MLTVYFESPNDPGAVFAPRHLVEAYRYDPNYKGLFEQGVRILPIEMNRIRMSENIQLAVALRIWEYYLKEIARLDDLDFVTFCGFVAGYGTDQSWEQFSSPHREAVLKLFDAYRNGVPLDDICAMS